MVKVAASGFRLDPTASLDSSWKVDGALSRVVPNAAVVTGKLAEEVAMDAPKRKGIATEATEEGVAVDVAVIGDATGAFCELDGSPDGIDRVITFGELFSKEVAGEEEDMDKSPVSVDVDDADITAEVGSVDSKSRVASLGLLAAGAIDLSPWVDC